MWRERSLSRSLKGREGGRAARWRALRQWGEGEEVTWLVAEREEGEGEGWEATRQDAERGGDGAISY